MLIKFKERAKDPNEFTVTTSLNPPPFLLIIPAFIEEEGEYNVCVAQIGIPDEYVRKIESAAKKDIVFSEFMTSFYNPYEAKTVSLIPIWILDLLSIPALIVCIIKSNNKKPANKSQAPK